MGADEHDRRWLGHEERQQLDGEIDKAREIGVHLGVELGQIDCLGIAQRNRVLDAGIENDVVDVRELSRNAVDVSLRAGLVMGSLLTGR